MKGLVIKIVNKFLTNFEILKNRNQILYTYKALKNKYLKIQYKLRHYKTRSLYFKNN